MIKRINHATMGGAQNKWLKSIFHFSFDDYYNPKNMNFGVLRVLNDDLVQAGRGFELHPHRDMEIISYVVEGELTHGDSLGHKKTITRGEIQYMSAGTGIYHSEHNLGKETLRLLQLWIYPDKRNYPPAYGDFSYKKEERHNRWLNIVSGPTGNAPIRIHQDANLFVGELDEGYELPFEVKPGRQAYVLQIEGRASFNEVILETRDAAEVDETNLTVKALTPTHVLIVEMAKEE